MNILRRSIGVSFLLIGFRAIAADGTADQLVMPEKLYPGLNSYLTSAIQQSPRMVSRALDLEMAENTRLVARSNLLPSITSSFAYYEASDDRADLPDRQRVTKVSYNVTIAQPVFFWGERRNAARIGEIQQKITQGQYREGYRLLAQEIRIAYLRLIQQKLSVKRTSFGRDFTAKQLLQEEDRLAKKVISEVEIAAARLSAEQAQIAADRAAFEFEMAKRTFARLVGVAEITDAAIPDMIPALTYTPAVYDQLLAGFLGQKELPSPEAFVLRKQLEIEKLNYAIHKTRLRPKLSAIIATNQDEQSYTANVAQKYRVNSVYAGGSVYWPIFDGFASGAIVRNSLARRRQLEIDYRQLTERLGQDAQTQVKTINFSARNMAIYDRYLNSSEASLASMREQNRLGVRSETEVSMAQISLYDAQINAINSRIDYFVRVADFLGTITEDPVLANLSVK